MAKDSKSLEDIVIDVAATIRPPERLTVAESAERHRRLKIPGGYSGPWKNSETPYLIEPMEILTDLRVRALILCAPAQCGKTEIGLNWIGHTLIHDPTDFMVLETVQERAADFSRRRVKRLLDDSPAFKNQLMPGRNNDNVFYKRMKSGVILTMAHPSASQLSGRPIPKLFLTDYDRMEQNVDGEGTPFDLARARTTTFGPLGMTYAESSPSMLVSDPRWAPQTPHQAPPVGGQGILTLYNRGDRRRWYWICVDCDMAFEPAFRLFKWDKEFENDPRKASKTMYLECPHCQSRYHEFPGDDNKPGKMQMNEKGLWIRDGMKWSKAKQEVVGDPYESDIASFWLKGPAARWQNWQTMVQDYIHANNEWEMTGNEESLISIVGTQQAEAYIPKALESLRKPELLRQRALPDLGERVVPAGVRFLLAAVDVQKSRFEVQVHGVGEGGDIWVIDRFKLRMSNREYKDPQTGQIRPSFLRPFDYREDWRVLLPHVIQKTYPLIDGSGRHMRIRATVCDSGGMDHATANAYDFVRWLRRGPSDEDTDRDIYAPIWERGVGNHFQLYKGDRNMNAPRTRITHPDSQRKDKFARARGEIPVMMVNTTTVKNHLDGILNREEYKSGSIFFPDWLDFTFYKELCVEIKNEKGQWENPNNYHNESWDLFVMTLALMVERTHVGYETIEWSDPPDWAEEWDDNSNVFDPKNDSGLDTSDNFNYNDFEKLGKEAG